MKRPEKKELNKSDFYSGNKFKDGYNQCKEDFDKYLPNLTEITHLVAETDLGEVGNYTPKHLSIAKEIHERIRE